MANVLFTRKNASEIPNVPITDGQLIFDTSGNGKMYLDNGTNRLEMGGALTVDATLSKTSTNPVQNKAVAGVMLDTLSDIGNVTSKGFLTDALAVKQLNTNVNELNNSLVANSNHFYFDYKNGKYGYNTNPNRGADTFVPFSNGNYYYRVFKGSDSVENRKDTLKVNTGVFFAYFSGTDIGDYQEAYTFCVKDGTVIVNRIRNGVFTFSYSNGTLSLYNMATARNYKCYGFYN